MSQATNTLKHFEKIDKVPSRIFYHYTSLDALYSIIQTRTFRLMSLKSSNDKTELSYNADNFIADYVEVCDDIFEQTEEESVKIFAQTTKAKVQREEKAIKKEFSKNKCQPYALCLSRKKDNLTHWDRYADQCKGVCIGINISAIDVFAKRFGFDDLADFLFDTDIISYSHEENKKRILLSMMRVFDVYYNYWGQQDIDKMIKIIEKDTSHMMASTGNRIVRFIKDSSFLDEDEVRLYHNSYSISDWFDILYSFTNPDLDEDTISAAELDIQNYNEFLDKMDIRQEKFAMTRTGIRGYRNMCLSEVWGSGVIPEIILGPMCIQNRQELNRFLHSNGLHNTKVSISKVPIR